MGAVDLVAGDVAGHELQAGYPEGSQVQVITNLPGAFVGAVEVGVLDRVGQVDGIATDEIEWRITVDFLIGQGETMGAQRVFTGQAVRRVVDGTGQRLTSVPGVIEVGVEEHPGLLEVQVAVVLMPGVGQIRGIQGAANRALGKQIGADKRNAAGLGIGAITEKVALA
ncbi:hypothetical protein D3C71_1477570 [compost metagenome]